MAESVYTYDSLGRLVSLVDSQGSTILASYAYTYAANRWIGETVTTYSGGSPSSVRATAFAYDGNQIVLQFDGSSALAPAALTAPNLSHRYLWGPAVDQILVDERVTVQNGALATAEVLWPLTDNQGTVRDVALLSGTTTSVVDHIIYSSFGGVVSESNRSQGCLFKYTGRPTDPATGLQHNLNRWYDAVLARWTSPTDELHGRRHESLPLLWEQPDERRRPRGHVIKLDGR